MPDYRSYSQVSDYERCPHHYYLKRNKKAWPRPAAWLAHGSALHLAAEKYERSERALTVKQAQGVFRDEYARIINETAAQTPNLGFWSDSGPQYDGWADVPRRWRIGQEQTAAYIGWAERTPDRAVWIADDGTPGIELPFAFDLDGVELRGIIDHVSLRKGEVEPIDVKSGKPPPDKLQLKIYGLALEALHGVIAKRGFYWSGKLKTGLSRARDLLSMSRQEVVDRAHAVDEGIRAERWDPTPSKEACSRCDVATSCPFRVR